MKNVLLLSMNTHKVVERGRSVEVGQNTEVIQVGLGVLGSISAARITPNLKPMDKVLMIFSGGVLSWFVPEVIISNFGMQGNSVFLISWLVGMFGWSFCGKFLMTIRDADFTAALESWIKKGDR